jgi:putative ABC transport system permease protein
MSESPLIYKQIARIARRNVLRNWRHSVATLLAISAGFMAIALLDGFTTSLDELASDSARKRGMFGDVVIAQKGANAAGFQDQWNHALNVEEQNFLKDFLKNDGDVKVYVRSLNVFGVAAAGDQSAVFVGTGIDLKEGAQMRGEKYAWSAIAGVPLEQVSEPSLALGMGLAHILGCDSTYKGKDFILPEGGLKAEERPFKCKVPSVTLSVSTESGQANVASYPTASITDNLVRELNRRAVAMDLVSVQQLLDTDKISAVNVELKEKVDANAFIQKLREASLAKGYQFEILHWYEHPAATQVLKSIQLQHTVRNIFLSVVVFIVIMSVTNTMMKSVNERIREIGTLRSIGFFRRHLIVMFSIEGMYLSLFACVVGLLLVLFSSQMISLADIRFSAGLLTTPISMRITWVPQSWLISAFILTGLATLTATLASRRAANMVVADAMRHL